MRLYSRSPHDPLAIGPQLYVLLHGLAGMSRVVVQAYWNLNLKREFIIG